MKVKETDCTRDILSYLSKIGIFAWRNNTGVLKGMSGHFVRFGYPGSSDILGINKDGRMLCIEVKSAGAPTTAKQIEFKGNVERNNGIYLTVVSLDDLIVKMKETP